MTKLYNFNEWREVQIYSKNKCEADKTTHCIPFASGEYSPTLRKGLLWIGYQETVVPVSIYLRRHYGLYHIQNHSKGNCELYQRVF